MNPKIERLIKQFAKLPRVGTRAATRIVFELLQNKTGKAQNLANGLLDAAQTIHPCPICGVLTENAICEYCSDNARQNGCLCVVRDISDVYILEKAGMFHGRYHVLGGNLSGVAGVTPADLNIANIPDRIKNENVSEIIFALPNTVEGKTTQQYIMSISGMSDVVFSELASGVPLGGDLDYLDDGTLMLAFGDRKKL